MRATTERIIANTRHTVGDGYGCQARATRESIIANIRHAVGDVKGGMTIHTVRDGD